MPLIINDTIQNNSGKPVDSKYGIFTGGSFRAYTSIGEANGTIPSAYRSIGLTVLINTGSANVEHWYRTGVADGDLVPKSTSVSASIPLTFGSGNLAISQSTISTDGYLSSIDWNIFNNKITNGSNLGSGSGIFAGVSGSSLTFKSLSVLANNGLTLTTTGTDITVSLNGIKEYTPSTTTDTIPTIINSIAIENNSAGFIEISMVAVSTTPGSALISKKYLAYQKISSILTNIGITTDIINPSLIGFTTASWDIVLNPSTNNLDIEVIGENSSIKWLMKSQKFFNS